MPLSLRRPFLFLVLLLSGFSALAQVANFNADATTGCAPLVVHFTNTSTGATSYHWDLGNGNQSFQTNASGSYTVAGTYTVTLTASAQGGGSSTHTMTITVYPSPAISFSASPQAGCPGFTASFTDQSNLQTQGLGTYLWDFGDGSNSTMQNPTHTFNISGLFSINEVVTNGQGCVSSHTETNYIDVYTPANISISVNSQQFCSAPGHAVFTNNSTGTPPFNCTWYFGDGGTSTDLNPTHDYNAVGTYTVKLVIVDGHGCTDSISYPNYIHVNTIAGNFTAPAQACLFSAVPFTNNFPVGVTSAWSFGDGGTSGDYSPTHAYGTAGTYTVTLTATSGPCSLAVSHVITILPAPVVNFTFSPLLACPPPQGIQFTMTGPPNSSYSWAFGDGGTSTQANPYHIYNSIGVYTIKLILHDVNGCADTVKHNDTLYDHLFTVTPTPDSGCAPLSVDFVTLSQTTMPDPQNGPYPYPSPITSYSWTFGDGGTSTQATPNHVYNNPGIYNATVTSITANGCSATATVQIRVGTKPHADFTTAPTHICADHRVQFTNTSTGNPTGYLWFFGDGNSGNDVNPLHEYEIPGTFTVTLIAYNNGCTDTIVYTNLIKVDSPKALLTEIIECAPPTRVEFTNISIGATSFNWIFGDNTTDNVNSNPVHDYPALGNYIVQLATYNATSGCRDTATVPITLSDIKANFTADDTAICKYGAVHFTPTSTGSGVISKYLWIIQNITFPQDTVGDLTDVFYTPGIYPVTLVVTDDHGCIDTIFRDHYILVAKPVDTFNATLTTGCTPITVQFTDYTTDQPGTTLTNHSWDYGDGNTFSTAGTTASHTYTTTGAYTVTEIVTDNIGCKDTLIKPAYINSIKPIAGFHATSTSICRNSPLTFTNLSTGGTLTYAWTFGDGGTSTEENPVHAYHINGTYTVGLVVTDNFGCTDTHTITDYITVYGPYSAFTMDDSTSICPPLTVHFTQTVTEGSPYQWHFGNGNSSFVPNPANTFTTAGNYTVSLVAVDAHGCRDTAYHNVKIYGYAGAFTYTPLLGCAPMEVSFTANLVNIPSLTWDFADGSTFTSTDYTTTHTYTVPGAYLPRLILADSTGCQSSSPGIDTIKVDGVMPAYTTSPACIGDTIYFQDNSVGLFSPVVGWHWTFDNGDTSIANNPSHYYGTDTGRYPVILYAINSNGCFATVTDTVTVHSLPIIDAGPDTTICMHDAATLAPAGGVSYIWSPPSTLSCTSCDNPQASPTVATTYTVIGTDVNGCKNSDTMTVHIKTKTHSVGHNAEFCFSDSVRLFDSGAQHYTWIPASGLSSTDIGNPNASPTVTTIYTVVAQDGSCEPDTNYIKVTVHPIPTVDAGTDQTMIAGDSVPLQALGTYISTYLWKPAEYLSCDSCYNPTASPHASTTYVVYVASDFGCTDSDNVYIDVICERSQVFIPNTFTPNGDGQNDVFYPRGKGISLIKSFRIYNRWGELMFEKANIQINDESNAWDGSYMGGKPKPDVYVYIIDAICDTGAPLDFKGDVTIIR